jgi:hypothetical protein
MSRTPQVAELAAFDGTYLRGADGVWRYAVTGRPVPGARDLTLSQFFDFPVRGRWRLIPRRVAASDPALAWCLEKSRDDVEVIEVPEKEWMARASAVVGIDAPELQPERLLTITHVAGLAGLAEMSIRRYIVPDRMSMPAPTVYVGATPCWVRPVIEHWLATRPGRGRPDPGRGPEIDRSPVSAGTTGSG